MNNREKVKAFEKMARGKLVVMATYNGGRDTVDIERPTGFDIANDRVSMLIVRCGGWIIPFDGGMTVELDEHHGTLQRVTTSGAGYAIRETYAVLHDITSSRDKGEKDVG